MDAYVRTHAHGSHYIASECILHSLEAEVFPFHPLQLCVESA